MNGRSQKAAVFVVSFGCIIGWGCFTLPGTAFLPKAGVLGVLLGLSIAAVIALLFCANYAGLSKAFPEADSSYLLIRNAFGADHAFFSVWSLPISISYSIIGKCLRYISSRAIYAGREDPVGLLL